MCTRPSSHVSVTWAKAWDAAGSLSVSPVLIVADGVGSLPVGGILRRDDALHDGLGGVHSGRQVPGAGAESSGPDKHQDEYAGGCDEEAADDGQFHQKAVGAEG